MLELSLHILDIAENAVRAGATRVEIHLAEDSAADTLTMEIRDDGAGMDEATRRKALDPFYTTKTVRRVGLGLPMLAQAAEGADGSFRLASTVGLGTTVTAVFRLSHIDRQPLGDMAGTMAILIAGNDGLDFVYEHCRGGRTYRFDTREIKKEIDDIPINHVEVLRFIRDHIQEGLKDICAHA